MALYNDKEACNKVSSWAKVLHGVPQGSVLGPLLFLICINDFPKIVNDETLLVLFADDSSVLVAHSNFIDFKALNKWFKVNLLSLNFNKMHFTHFTTMRNKMIDLNVGYKDKLISHISHTNFFDIILDSTLTWSNNFELLTTKLTTACYLIRTVKPYMPESALKNDLPLPFFPLS